MKKGKITNDDLQNFPCRHFSIDEQSSMMERRFLKFMNAKVNELLGGRI